MTSWATDKILLATLREKLGIDYRKWRVRRIRIDLVPGDRYPLVTVTVDCGGDLASLIDAVAPFAEVEYQSLDGKQIQTLEQYIAEEEKTE